MRFWDASGLVPLLIQQARFPRSVEKANSYQYKPGELF